MSESFRLIPASQSGFEQRTPQFLSAAFPGHFHPLKTFSGNWPFSWRVPCDDRFLRLYVEHEEALRGFVRSLVPTLEDAREVMQQTAAVLWRKFDGSADFRPWSFGVAKFEALAFLRDRARDRHVFGDEVMALLEAEAMDAAQSSEQEERALEECLQKLPAAQRELVETAYAPGVRMDELARSAGRTPMALYKTLHRIRMTLADCVQLTLNQKDELA